MESFLMEDKYHIPRACEKCGGVMIFKGVGEYRCEDCGAVDYDDYGKVRLFIEQHPGATAAQVEMEIGVSQRTVRQLLKDGRLEVASDSVAFLHCEVCGKTIRSGRFCAECETAAHRKLEEQQRERSKKNMQVFGKSQTGDEGQKRFTRRDG